jgi:hypothetical protein
VNPDSGEILASELTSNQVGDSTMVGPLLDQIPGDMASILADGAYDGEPVYRAITGSGANSCLKTETTYLFFLEGRIDRPFSSFLHDRTGGGTLFAPEPCCALLGIPDGPGHLAGADSPSYGSLPPGEPPTPRPLAK